MFRKIELTENDEMRVQMLYLLVKSLNSTSLRILESLISDEILRYRNPQCGLNDRSMALAESSRAHLYKENPEQSLMSEFSENKTNLMDIFNALNPADVVSTFFSRISDLKPEEDAPKQCTCAECGQKRTETPKENYNAQKRNPINYILQATIQNTVNAMLSAQTAAPVHTAETTETATTTTPTTESNTVNSTGTTNQHTNVQDNEGTKGKSSKK